MDTMYRRFAMIAVLSAMVPQACRAAQDVCFGTGVRPILLVPGFQGSPLFDSRRKYNIEWPDVDAFFQQYSFDDGEPTDLDLPMNWTKAEGDVKKQAISPVGPERSENDEYPSLDGFIGDLFELVVYSPLQNLATSFRHPRDPSLQMYYTVAYDYRRDLWEQSERVYKALRRVHNITNCKTILVGHSFGSRLIYTLLARYGEDAADLVAGTLYAVGNFHGGSTHVASLTLDMDIKTNPNRAPVDTLFTFPSVYTLGPSYEDSCRNADELFSKRTFPCQQGKFPTGINCDSAACGRPASWPAGKPFFLPLDLQDPDVWLKIGAAQPTLQTVSPAEETHLQSVLKTARRMSDSVAGEVGKATQKIHPPGAIISMQLTEESLPPSPEPPASMNHYITCVPSDSFGVENATEFWCKDFERGGSMAGDGTLTTYMMELTGAGWERSIQTFRMTERPRQWPRLGRGPHAGALLISKNSNMPLVCSEQKLPDPKCAPQTFPTLEELLCSLVYRANNPGEQYPSPNSKQCPGPAGGPKTEINPLVAGDENESGIGAWFQRIFGRFQGSGPSGTRNLPEEVMERAGPVIQRSTEALGTVAAANWIYQRMRRPQT